MDGERNRFPDGLGATLTLQTRHKYLFSILACLELTGMNCQEDCAATPEQPVRSSLR